MHSLSGQGEGWGEGRSGGGVRRGSLVGRVSRRRKPTRPYLSDYAALIRPTHFDEHSSSAL